MKSKLCWASFVPLTLIAVFLKLSQAMFPDGTMLGLSSLMLDYLFIAVIVLILLFSALFCLLDKKISPYYLPHRNPAAGIIGMLIALLFAADGAGILFRLFGSGTVDALGIAEAVLLLLSAVVFVTMGLTHSFKAGESKRFALFNVMPALLCAVRMVAVFVQFTTISIRLADVPMLVCYIFATLFFFNYAVALSLTKAKNAVKSCFVFGFPAVASLLTCGGCTLLFRFDTQDIFANLGAAEMLLVALYIFAFLIELTAFVPDNDSIELVSEADDGIARVPVNADGFVVGTNDEDERDAHSDADYISRADTRSYLYRESPRNATEPYGYSGDSSDNADYLTDIYKSQNDNDNPENPRSYAERMDEIDKLILDISSKSD